MDPETIATLAVIAGAGDWGKGLQNCQDFCIKIVCPNSFIFCSSLKNKLTNSKVKLKNLLNSEKVYAGIWTWDRWMEGKENSSGLSANSLTKKILN